ncbi:MAG: alcohol dehydrogenase catalytic domain-containing protein [Chloroflexi bacterium]|nr:alcohol dehydrogenase catalytic domain-containing protein [Chloroflexota bacterium]
MKAWRLHGFGDFRLDDVLVPKIQEGWVLIKVKVVQPSVTDTAAIKGRGGMTAERTLKILAETGPRQLGHEFCGEVAQLGKGATSLKVGDRVSFDGNIHCGACRPCLAGRHSECLSPKRLGFEIPGAFAEYVSLPEWAAVKMPDGPTDNEVAAFQPVACSMGAVRSAEIKVGESVVVLGQGQIGLGVLQIARISGAGLLVAVARRPESLELARRYGADVVIDARQSDPVAEVRKLTDDSGADVVFDTAGGNREHGLSGYETARQAIEMVRRRGKVVECSNLEGTLDLPAVPMHVKSVRFINADAGGRELLRQVAYMTASGRIQVGPQITHVVQGLERLPEAMEITENKAKYHATSPAQIVV